MPFAMSSFLRIAFALTVVEGLHTFGQVAHNAKKDTAGSSHEAYTFDTFVREFGRAFESGSDEYARRAAIFQASLSQIRAKNSRGKRSWTAGVNPFMDLTSAERLERLHGYKLSTLHRAVQTNFAGLQTSGTTAATERYGGADDSFEAETPAVQDQDRDGQCGSCWAFAAVEAVEAQLMKIRSPVLPAGEPRLSVQALLDCVPKENTCDGGCKGSSAENAFDFMQEHGVPLESDVPYNPRQTGKCPIEPYPLDWVRVTLAGWRALPSNQAQPLMQAIVQDGPATATADAHEWYDYYSGIFDGCPKDALPNHNVLVRGYGIEDGTKYWLVQNSWGTKWGENGAIRLARQDDDDEWCGVDSESDGYGCDGDTHMNVTICGTCGLLYNAVVPQVGYVLVGPGPTSAHAGAASSDQATSDEKRIYESHVKARRAESDVEELARQMESMPSSDGEVSRGEEAQQLDQVANRVQLGEQQLARQLGPIAQTEDKSSEEILREQPRSTVRTAQSKHEPGNEDQMQAALGDERGKAHTQRLDWSPPLAREEGPERMKRQAEAHADSESVDTDEDEQALELESVASASSEEDSEDGSEVNQDPMWTPPLSAQNTADARASRQQANDLVATSEVPMTQSSVARRIRSEGMQHRHDSAGRTTTIARMSGEFPHTVPMVVYHADPFHDTNVTVAVRSRVLRPEDAKPHGVDAVSDLSAEDEDMWDRGAVGSVTSVPSNIEGAPKDPMVDGDAVRAFPSREEARVLHAQVRDRFSPTGSLDGYLRR